jgi:hypothetical protein
MGRRELNSHCQADLAGVQVRRQWSLRRGSMSVCADLHFEPRAETSGPQAIQRSPKRVAVRRLSLARARRCPIGTRC